MKLYISAVFENCGRKGAIHKNVETVVDLSRLHILQSYAYATEKHAEKYGLCKDFLMDSGAFTVMNNKKGKENFNPVEFTKMYGAFVKKWNVKDFIELDIDGVFGMQVYVDCLHRLQDITGREPIRVMHFWRGREYFEELTKRKEFICIGGLAGMKDIGINRTELQWFIDVAHKNKCRIHGLGIGDMNLVRKHDFDSVDSANWTLSLRYGTLLRFNGHELCKYAGSEGAGENEHISAQYVAERSLKEWEKLSHYIDLF